MGTTNQKQTQKSQQLTQIITSSYNPTDQKLSLYYQPNNWKSVLLSKDWSMLRNLQLYGSLITDDDVKIFQHVQHVNLETLWISYNLLTDKGVKELFGKSWSKLHDLSLSNNNIGDEGLIYLLTNNKVPALTQLRAEKNEITSKSMLPLLKFTETHQLTVLELSDNAIGATGAKLITKMNMPNLTILFLCGCSISPTGINHLSKGNWPQLNNLAIAQNNYHDNGNSQITKSNWKSLTILQLKQFDIIMVLHFVASVWDKKLIASFRTKNQEFEVNVYEIMGTRFNQS